MIWALAAALLVAGAVVPALAGRPRLAGPQARARSAHARLLHAVETTTREAAVVARAQERLTTCGALLAQARTPGQLRLAERVAHEGLDLLRS